jgi:hypothetical protein
MEGEMPAGIREFYFAKPISGFNVLPLTKMPHAQNAASSSVL